MHVNYLMEDDDYCIANDPTWEEPEYDLGYNPYEDPRYVPLTEVKTYYIKKEKLDEYSLKNIIFNTIVTKEIVANTLSNKPSIENVKVLGYEDAIKGSDISISNGNGLICVRTSFNGGVNVGESLRKFGRFNYLATIINDSVYVLDRYIAFINIHGNGIRFIANDRFVDNVNRTKTGNKYCFKFIMSDIDINYYKEQLDNLKSIKGNTLNDIVDAFSDSFLVRFGKHLNIKLY